jgi:hypothetical protein
VSNYVARLAFGVISSFAFMKADLPLLLEEEEKAA